MCQIYFYDYTWTEKGKSWKMTETCTENKSKLLNMFEGMW